MADDIGKSTNEQLLPAIKVSKQESSPPLKVIKKKLVDMNLIQKVNKSRNNRQFNSLNQSKVNMFAESQ